MKDTIRWLKWISAGLEAFLGIPIIGGSIVVNLAWTPLLVMLALHSTIVVLARKEHVANGANTIGIITSFIAWIPIVGIIMHLITSVRIIFETRNDKKAQAH